MGIGVITRVASDRMLGVRHGRRQTNQPATARSGPGGGNTKGSSDLERLNGEVKRLTAVVGIFPNAWTAKRTKAIVGRVGSILPGQNDE